MHHLSAIASAGRHVSKLAVLGALSTFVAAAGTTWLVTGSSDPNVWVADFRHALGCAVADPALDTSCHVVAGVPAVDVQPAGESASPPSPASTVEPSPASTADEKMAPKPGTAPQSSQPEEDEFDESDS